MPRAFATKAVLVASLAVLLVLPATASAVLSGANGRIAYVSGRGFTDAKAKLYLRVATGSFGLGVNTGPLSLSSGQHRHPTWSPDRTKIAYARGDASCNPTKCDIYVLDLTNPFAVPQDITNTANVNEDRPAWSPDGTRIAYESEVSNGSGQVDILVDPVGAGPTLNLTNTAVTIEGKPAWTPDSAEIYYHTGNPTLENSLNIVKEPSTGGAVTNIATSGAENEFQPSISPDGKKMCFTRGTKAGSNGTADVIVALANGGGQDNITSDNVGEAAANGDYNCTWSPDGQFIAYVRGTFSTGELVMERADDTSPFPITLEASDTFDGNPDWAPDGRPACEDVTVNTAFDQPVTVPLKCLDTGPFYERSQVQEFTAGKPANGTLSEVTQGDQEPSTVTYTPNPGSSGTDTFEFSSFDQIAGFSESPATVTINVAAPPQPDLDQPPVVSNVTVKPGKWRLGSRLPKVSAVRTGATVRWRLSEDASTKLIFQRALKGRRVGKRCVKQTSANASKPRCKRFRNAGSLTRNGKAGANALSFQGRLTRSKRLSPGIYRVAAQARDSAGQLSKTSSSRVFKILPAN
jgi:Tol biopolymer transport system component